MVDNVYLINSTYDFVWTAYFDSCIIESKWFGFTCEWCSYAFKHYRVESTKRVIALLIHPQLYDMGTQSSSLSPAARIALLNLLDQSRLGFSISVMKEEVEHSPTKQIWKRNTLLVFDLCSRGSSTEASTKPVVITSGSRKNLMLMMYDVSLLVNDQIRAPYSLSSHGYTLLPEADETMKIRIPQHSWPACI